MGRPFNFFGFSSGTIGHGLISAYPTNFSGYYTPKGVYNTPGGYIFGIEDLNVTYGQFSIIQTGSLISTNVHSYSLNSTFSGNFFPVLSESGLISVQYTGQTVKVDIDSSIYNTNITGQINQLGLDIESYNLIFTGKFSKISTDYNFTSNIISGNFAPTLIDVPNYLLIFSGNIIKYEKDNVSLNGGMESITWTKGSPVIQEDNTDAAIIITQLQYIGWSQLN